MGNFKSYFQWYKLQRKLMIVLAVFLPWLRQMILMWYSIVIFGCDFQLCSYHTVNSSQGLSPNMNMTSLTSLNNVLYGFSFVALSFCVLLDSGSSKCLWWALTSLNRFMKRGPYRHGLCLWHCRELTVIWLARCDATATMNTASYMRAADVCTEIKIIPKYF